jgi:hypothetical protein
MASSQDDGIRPAPTTRRAQQRFGDVEHFHRTHLTGQRDGTHGSFIDRPDPPAVAKREARGPPAYRVVDVPGKGKGVVAVWKIKKGEIVMEGIPAVRASTVFIMETKPHHRRRLMKAAFGQLPEETKKAVHGLRKGAEKQVLQGRHPHRAGHS